MSMITLRNVSKCVKDGENYLQILNGIDLNIDQGDLVSVVGKSGSGKTTLLTILSLLDIDFDGTYIFLDQDIKKLSKKKVFELRSKYIANVFQSFNLIEELSVLENIEMPLGFRGVDKKERQEIALKYLDWVGLASKKDSEIYSLSGGEQQRISLARALSMGSKILLLDEPTGNLDVNTSKEMIDLIIAANKELKITCLIVTHDLEIAKRCDRNIEIKNGALHEE